MKENKRSTDDLKVGMKSFNHNTANRSGRNYYNGNGDNSQKDNWKAMNQRTLKKIRRDNGDFWNRKNLGGDQRKKMKPYSKVHQHDNRHHSPSNSSYAVDTKGCRIPDFKPFHNDALPFFENKPEMVCNNGLGPLVVLSNGTLYVDPEVAKDPVYGGDKMPCVYRSIIKPPRKDKSVALGPSVPFLKKTKVTDMLVYVECFDKFHKGVIYKDVKFQIIRNDNIKNEPKFGSDPKNRPLNVVLIGLDSTSRLNFKRQLPELHDYLVNEMGAIEMKGLTRVGDHTLPNILPLLTGEYLEEMEEKERRAKEELKYGVKQPLKRQRGSKFDKVQNKS